MIRRSSFIALAVASMSLAASCSGPPSDSPTPQATPPGGTPTQEPFVYPYERTLYVRGTINGWTGDEEALAPYQLSPISDHELYAEVVVPFGAQQFKVADSGWSLGTNFGNPAGTNDVITLGVPKIMGDNGFNLLLDVETSGIYSFLVDHTELLEPSVVVNFVEEVEDICAPDLSASRARWMSADTLVWRAADADSYFLYHAPQGGIALEDGQLTGGAEIALTKGEKIDADHPWYDVYPYLRNQDTFTAEGLADLAPDLLKGQLVIASRNADGEVCSATGVQTWGAIDELYTYEGDDLGPTYAGSAPTLKLWAPTAQAVTLLIFDSSADADPSSEIPMARGTDGVWTATGDASWDKKFYRYEVAVFVPSEGAVVTSEVTDPYSVSLSMNSQRSQIVDLADPSLMPEGWGDVTKPPLEAPEDITLYELHVRDFSASDDTVPAASKGHFAAFAESGTRGRSHLEALAASGLTHVHLLPAFDIATVEEDPAARTEPTIPQSAGPASEEQQAAVNAARGTDAFNWGYDPWHWGVPEGSYSADPDGPERILEFREMVKGLSEIGLRVVMDQVYNHTNAAGLSEKSVLDKIVPGYYYRLDDSGFIQGSSCCPDTATEHAMMEKLMVDMVVRWATAYKVDGFRFDLMGHHTKANMAKVRAALDSLTPQADGVDGRILYLYGEGWKFGSLDAILPEQAASQANTFGLGIGTFNDRIRDSVRGGSPFSPLWEQGFATGLFYDDNHLDQGSSQDDEAYLNAQRTTLNNLADNIRVAMAGNLRDYAFTGASGETVTGADVTYRGAAGAGYTADPQEIINYVSVHDNQTLFDNIQAKAPFRVESRDPESATMAERVRMHNLSLSVVALGQGIPFFHAGSDMLRSKSGDKDSYDSGDWFNRLDFTYQENGWGAGLPIADKNQGDWDFWEPRLEDPLLAPTADDTLEAVNQLRELLAIRKSTPLLRLRTAADIEARVRFLNAALGEEQVPGLIVMEVSDEEGEDLDPQRAALLVMINATPDNVSFPVAGSWTKHAVQQESADAVVKAASCAGDGAILVPPRTTLVCER